jgi:hypothetical protein
MQQAVIGIRQLKFFIGKLLDTLSTHLMALDGKQCMLVTVNWPLYTDMASKKPNAS